MVITGEHHREPRQGRQTGLHELVIGHGHLLPDLDEGRPANLPQSAIGSRRNTNVAMSSPDNGAGGVAEHGEHLARLLPGLPAPPVGSLGGEPPRSAPADGDQPRSAHRPTGLSNSRPIHHHRPHSGATSSGGGGAGCQGGTARRLAVQHRVQQRESELADAGAAAASTCWRRRPRRCRTGGAPPAPPGSRASSRCVR